MEQRITDNLSSLLEILPPEITEVILQMDRNDELLEVIFDLGRVPTVRFTDGEYTLLDREVTQDDIDLIVLQVGEFDADNRAGIERTLHRISGIRNRRGEVVGLTCRVGRAVYGTIDIIREIIESGKSILILGKPGVGKTTMLREAARVLAESKRVVVVDTSNEIGGDGDIPHPAVGKARRMQVPMPSLQHEVMIEAVENHNPEVIVIDEIGRELEALAARTIAERGVQLIGTAHGITLDNLLLNPTLSDLVGGIESVTLSDEEARRRGTQKTVLERRAPPTFHVLIELQDRNTLKIHHDVAVAVDMLLRGSPLVPEIRHRGPNGEVTVEAAPEPQVATRGNGRKVRRAMEHERHVAQNNIRPPEDPPEPRVRGLTSARKMSVYPYGVARNRLIESARRFKLPMEVTDALDEADVLLTLKNFYRRRPRLISDAEQRGIPIYVLRSNTVTQIEDFLADLYELEVEEDDEVTRAIREAEDGIQAVMNGAPTVDLSPQTASVRRQQHEMARRAHLSSHSYGKEPHRHVRIYRE
jgi:stage III sporulation protein SpoIIIAA